MPYRMEWFFHLICPHVFSQWKAGQEYLSSRFIVLASWTMIQGISNCIKLKNTCLVFHAHNKRFHLSKIYTVAYYYNSIIIALIFVHKVSDFKTCKNLKTFYTTWDVLESLGTCFHIDKQLIANPVPVSVY